MAKKLSKKDKELEAEMNAILAHPNNKKWLNDVFKDIVIYGSATTHLGKKNG